jgi:uncharacterized protein
MLANYKANGNLQFMKTRAVINRLKRALNVYPAVALIGPRQCGKTTLARSMGGHYFDIEDDSDGLKLDLAWDRLTNADELIVLDEAQSKPEVFRRLRTSIDRRRAQNGRFLLLGSVSPALMREVSESLAGRLALIELTPFFLDELSDSALDTLWLNGGFPDGGVLRKGAMPDWQANYLALLAQRDLPAWGLPAKPQVTQRLFRMLAAVHGALWNASAIGQSLGLNYQTVNNYVDLLEGAFLIRRLPPYHVNIKKRLVKSPKVYWRDSGLLHALMGVSDMDSLLSQPWAGASWEGFVIQQAAARLEASGIPCSLYSLRTSDRYEVDLVLDFGSERWACEIKLTTHPGPDDLARLNKVADWVRANRRVLISRTTEPLAQDGCHSLDVAGFLRLLANESPSGKKRDVS